MYGTVARFHLKPGMQRKLVEHLSTFSELNVPGFIAEYVYQIDNEPNTYYMAAIFESREAYLANAGSAQMHQFYLKTMEFVDGEFEWHDGEVIFPTA